MKNKVPTRLSAQAKQQRAYNSVTSDRVIIFPSERRALNCNNHVHAKHSKKFTEATPPRSL